MDLYFYLSIQNVLLHIPNDYCLFRHTAKWELKLLFPLQNKNSITASARPPMCKYKEGKDNNTIIKDSESINGVKTVIHSTLCQEK